jgi:hypothetical protein
LGSAKEKEAFLLKYVFISSLVLRCLWRKSLFDIRSAKSAGNPSKKEKLFLEIGTAPIGSGGRCRSNFVIPLRDLLLF